MFQNMFRKRGRPREQLQLGRFDEPTHEEPLSQIPVHQSLVPLDEPKQLPLQPLREYDQDVVMEDNNRAGLIQQPQGDNDEPRQDNMLAYDPQQV